MDVTYELFLKPFYNIFSRNNSTRKKGTEEEKIPKLSYNNFTIANYKGIDSVEIDLAKNSLVLLLGLNESGKTTILKAIESFSFLNDPEPEFDPKYFQKIRKKSAVGSNDPAIITATIKLEEKLPEIAKRKIGEHELSDIDIENINSFLHYLNQQQTFKISRIFPFKNGSPKKYYYQFEIDHPFLKNPLSKIVAQEIVGVCPFIIYFEDFKDRIPEKIFINKKREDSYDPVWYDIIDGLFYNTDSNFSIENVKKFHSPTNPMLDDAATVETRVNQTLNETFTKQWKDLSGVKEISTTELKYNHHRSAPYFTLKIKDSDGTTYSVDERSKGALWYLSFLMKTEFRSKKMRKNFGKPVFLIDEPASNLHSTAQKNMIKDFQKLAKDTSIVYTTHSQYLISTKNIKNTYIIEKNEGTVLAAKWGEYLNRNDAKVYYYQPLANLLNLIPSTFDIPWRKCIITEGPSDRHVLIALNRLYKLSLEDYAIYPGGSADKLADLISLNIGWNSSFAVLLDSDKPGENAARKYKTTFGIGSQIVHIPKVAKKIENCFTKEEITEIRNLVLSDLEKKFVSKKEFAAMWSILSEDVTFDKRIKKIISSDTQALFNKLCDELKNCCE